MTLHCVLCNRPMKFASVYFAGMPIGPTCARKTNLVKLAARGNNRLLKLCAPARRGRDDAQMEMDLEVAA